VGGGCPVREGGPLSAHGTMRVLRHLARLIDERPACRPLLHIAGLIPLLLVHLALPEALPTRPLLERHVAGAQSVSVCSPLT